MTRKALLPFFVLMLFLVPVAQCFTINDTDFNFVNSHGGNVRFGDVFTTTQYNVANTLSRFLSLGFGGTNYGTLSFDCDTGVNMTILSVSRYGISYNVSAAGASTQYIHYANNDHAPRGTNTDTITYNAATDIATVTTTGNVIVTLEYDTMGGLGTTGLEYFLNIFPLVAFFAALEAKKRNLVENRIVIAALVFALAAMILMIIRASGAEAIFI